MTSVFDGYQPYKGDIPRRVTGSLIAFETGEAVVYGLYNAQERGSLFIGAGVQVYEGMIVGQSPKTLRPAGRDSLKESVRPPRPS